MKPLHFLLLLGLLAFTACQSNTTTTETTTTDETALPPNNPIQPAAMLTPLFNTTDGVFRGMDFSMDMSTILAKESAELVEQVGNTAAYSIDFNESEFADVTYVSNGATLSKITVDIYAGSPESAATWARELKGLFDQKYLARTDAIWDGSHNGTVFSAFVNLVEDAEAPGVVIVWEPIAK